MKQGIITVMGEARIQSMTKELKTMEPGELDNRVLADLRAEVNRLLRLSDPTPQHSNRHTCISDDGGTPNRRCYACDAEESRLP